MLWLLNNRRLWTLNYARVRSELKTVGGPCFENSVASKLSHFFSGLAVISAQFIENKCVKVFKTGAKASSRLGIRTKKIY
jgi:hypothetical protein